MKVSFQKVFCQLPLSSQVWKNAHLIFFSQHLVLRLVLLKDFGYGGDMSRFAFIKLHTEGWIKWPRSEKLLLSLLFFLCFHILLFPFLHSSFFFLGECILSVHCTQSTTQGFATRDSAERPALWLQQACAQPRHPLFIVLSKKNLWTVILFR